MKEFIEKLIRKLDVLEQIRLDMHDWQGQSAVADVIEIVNQLAEEYKSNLSENLTGWIPCSERLPEDGQYIIVTTHEGESDFGWYEAKKNWCVNDSYFPNAFYFTAWQPLPEPYKEGE